ncbi:MAG: IS1182 family transposase [Actinobacteria bacterium]|nr:IS1182 family transposase [Actinomycetota bacterium]
MIEPMPLFPLPEARSPAKRPTRPEEARLRRAVRGQVEWMTCDLEAMVPEEHPARAIWELLESLDLSAFYTKIKAVLDRPGRPGADPKVLLSLWLLATVENVGSARRLANLCEQHVAYRWLRGGVAVNYHGLSDFRVAHQEALDQLLTQIVACLMRSGAVDLKRVAQDGMRVRASAGASSYRRKESLEECLREAEARVKELAVERDRPGSGASNREQRARERGAEERLARVKKALAYLPQAETVKEKQKRRLTKGRREKVREARVSTTDPEASVMKMPDGGFRPAYNVELVTDSGHGIIVGIAVTAKGTDAGQAAPLEDQVSRRTGQHPADYLIDGGFNSRADITHLAQHGVTVYMPVREPRNKPESERYQPGQGDTPEVKAWRQRMATEEAKKIYRGRAATAEWANAQVRWHGLSRFTVRGLANATTFMLLVVVAHNLLRWMAMAA